VIRLRFGGGRALTVIVLWGLMVARAQGPIDPTIGLSNLVFDVSYYKKANPDLANLSDADAQTNWLNSGAANYGAAVDHYLRSGRREGRKGLFAIDQSYLSHVPTSAGLTTKPADRVETFTSVTGQTITVVIQAPAPATDATYTMRPINPGELPDTYFPLALNNAITAKAATLLIPKGVYNFQGSDAVFQHWTIDGVTDMTIDGQGSTLNFSKVEFGIFLNNVTRVVFRNFVLDWPNLKMFALGKIVAGPNGQNQLQIDPAYPDDGSKAIEAISLWDDVNNTWSRQAPIDEYYGAPVFSHVPPPAYQGNQIYTSSTLTDYKVGMAVLVRYYYGEGTAMVIAASNDLALENVTVHSAPGLGFFFFGGRGFRLSGCVVDRANGRPISVTSGGLQFNNNAGDVLVENSVFAYHGDDGINLGASSLFPVQTVNGNKLTLGSSDSTPQAGDAVYIYNSAWNLLGFSSLQAVAPGAGGGFDVQRSPIWPPMAGWENSMPSAPAGSFETTSSSTATAAASSPRRPTV
jgi:hypothetical protein